MGRIKFILLATLLFTSLLTQANDSVLNCKLIDSVLGNFTDFTVDNLGNIYVVTATNQIKKINKNLDSVAVFNNKKKLGNVSLIDASNPLKILIFYKDFSTIIVLDRFLNVQQTIDLRKQNIFQVKTIALSYDNNIWLFDELDASIKKIDEQGKIVFSSSNFRMLFDEYENPTNMFDSKGLLYLYNSKTGWLIFDYYGALKNKIEILHWENVNVIEETLIGTANYHLFKSSPKKLSLKEISIKGSLGVFKKIVIQKNSVFTLTSNSIKTFVIQ